MKFYCKNCKSVFEPNGWHEYDAKTEECPFCKAGKLVVPIPDYEAVEQYEKRTGEKYPDDGIVWVRYTIDTWGHLCKWRIMSYKDAVNEKGVCDIGIDECTILCILPPVPPPDNWKPDEKV